MNPMLKTALRRATACALLCAAPWISAQAASLQLSTFEAGPGAIGVHVGVTDVADLYAWQVSIAFDPALLQLASVSEGAFLAGGGPTFFDGGAIDNAAGTLSFALGTIVGAVPGASGSGTLASLLFGTVGVGTTTLTMGDVMVLDSALADISVDVGSLTVTAVPEPESASLIAAGLLGLLAARRTRLRALMA